MGPTEEGLELTAEEAENDERTHPAHLVDHRFVDILDAGKRFCCHAVVIPAKLNMIKRRGMRPLRSGDPTKVCPSLDRMPEKKPTAKMAI